MNKERFMRGMIYFYCVLYFILFFFIYSLRKISAVRTIWREWNTHSCRSILSAAARCTTACRGHWPMENTWKFHSNLWYFLWNVTCSCALSKQWQQLRLTCLFQANSILVIKTAKYIIWILIEWIYHPSTICDER